MAIKIDELINQPITQVSGLTTCFDRGYVELSATPSSPEAVGVDAVGGPAQVNGRDFLVIGNKIYFKNVPGVSAGLENSDIYGRAILYPSYKVVLRAIYNS